MKHLRPSTDHRGLNERAISAAMQLLEDSDPCPPTVDQIAVMLDEPVGRLRTLFPDDRSVLIASLEQAMILLIDTCTRAVVKVDPDDPVAQFSSLGDAYLDWAHSNPDQFRLMMDCRLVDALTVPILRRYTDSLSELMVRMLTRARDAGRLHPREDIPMLVLSSRCYANGVARMMVDGRLQEWVPGGEPLAVAKGLTRDFVRRMARSTQPEPV